MGMKQRSFEPLPPVTLEDLVPTDHFYRHLQRTHLVNEWLTPVGRIGGRSI